MTSIDDRDVAPRVVELHELLNADIPIHGSFNETNDGYDDDDEPFVYPDNDNTTSHADSEEEEEFVYQPSSVLAQTPEHPVDSVSVTSSRLSPSNIFSSPPEVISPSPVPLPVPIPVLTATPLTTSHPTREPTPVLPILPVPITNPIESAIVRLEQSTPSILPPLPNVSITPPHSPLPLPPVVPKSVRPAVAQLDAVHAVASSGAFSDLKGLFNRAEEEGVEAFSLANDISLKTGFTALHVAASRGYLDIVTWLIEECGAMPDLEDREGETALHKASLNGHILILKYLVPAKADVHAQDADGWTALHNACSKGYLDIVRYLCEVGGAASHADGSLRVDARSKDGWTPLMNAASKGHLPVVRYLLSKQGANPLVRNNWGETAYDAAAAVFEVWICQVLQQAEASRWRGTTAPYNTLLVHTTIPLLLYENQRLDMRLKTVAVAGRPRFTNSGLGKPGRRAAYELKLPQPDEETGALIIPAWKSGVQLPLRSEPGNIPKPGKDDRGTYENSEKSHFWLSDWTLDVTPPGVDAEEGWQYAHTFNDPEEQWTPGKPIALERLLSGTGIVAAGFGSRAGPSSSSASIRTQSWVRRRRWVRILRRRLDIPPMPFLEPDGAMYYFDAAGNPIPHIDDNNSDAGVTEGRELGSMRPTPLSSAKDYVGRARYLVGQQPTDEVSTQLSGVEARRAIAKLERATSELGQGIPNDDNPERRTQAEVLLNTYSRDLERRRLAAGAQGLLVSLDDHYDEDDEEDDDDEFRYPGADISRPASRASGMAESTRSKHRIPDLTPQLSQAPEFRVPTHEAPQKVLGPRWAPPTPHQVHAQWERDEAVQQCRGCHRRFNFITRRHCRKCGRIFCDRCSSTRAVLDPSEIIQDPYSLASAASASSHRVCQTCYDQVNATIPTNFRPTQANSMERILVEQARLTVPGHHNRRQTSSQLSDLAECPVCNRNLDDFGTVEDQEAHVKNCLDGGSPGTANQTARYLVYRLPDDSALLGVECVICLEEFVPGSMIARLSCFCSFHSVCLSSWLQRGKSCPVHAR